MTNGENGGFGAKCDRLLFIRTRADLADLVPAIAPIAPLDDWPATASETRHASYAAMLRGHRPGLEAHVAEICGAPPWIVRSSGDEDLADDVNAGGYDSVICERADALYESVARVALSGSHDHARQQRALAGRSPRAEPIPCFVQPLLDVAVAPAVEPEQAPYLPDAALDRIEGVVRRLFELFDMAAIDCEWGIETDCGFVSGTSIVARDPAAMNGQHAFGFGFASAQTVAGRPTATVVTPAGSRLRLRRGEQSRMTRPRRFHLLQARPAGLEPALRDVAVLSAASRSALERRCEMRDTSLLLAGTRERGPFLVAPSLASAWRRYLAMDAARRSSLALVLVDEGSAAEHAGIMFRQSGVTCLLTATGRVPTTAACAIFDRTRCYFGAAATIADAQTEVQAVMPLPADYFHGFVEAADPSRESSAVREALAALPLDPEVRAAILDRSLYPADDCWLADGERVGSPSLAGVALHRGSNPPPPAAAQRADFHALYSRAARHAARSLHAARSPQERLALLPDLRIGVALLRQEQVAGIDALHRAPPDAGGAVALAAARADAGDVRGARLILQCFVATAAALDELPIYEVDERMALIEALGRAFRSGVDPADALAVYPLQLPVAATLRLLAATVDDPAFRDMALRFQRAHAAFLAAPPEAAAEAGQTLNAEAATLFARMVGVPELADVAGLIRGTLIESYDAALKAILVELVDGRAGSFIPYLDVMAAWIAWARNAPLSVMEARVLDRFDQWLGDARAGPAPDDFTIEDRNWRVEFPQVAAEATDAYENPHVLHNLLHQWMLSGNVVGSSMLPRRLRALHHFCTTFSMRATKVLRFAAGLFELEIPMGTHKVSFAFTPGGITIEWSEPPDCPDDEIARVLAFELLLERFRQWSFSTLTYQREKVIGTWTLIIRIGAPSGRNWSFDDYWQAVVALRFLFDSTYDFSYVENDAVDGLAESLEAPEWRSIIDVLIDYRRTFDDTAQYVFLHTVPLSSAITTLAQSGVARGLVRRCHRGGFAATAALIDGFAEWLDHGDDAERWARRYELLRQACLFAAAAWPRAVVERLALQDDGHAGDELLACCVLRRIDMHAPVRTLASPGGDGTGWFGKLVLRHVPDLLLTAEAAPAMAPAIVALPSINKRAKHHLVARRSDALDPAALDRLALDLDTVPFADDARAEERVAAALRNGTPHLRFDLARGVDWPALDAWYEALS